MKNILFFLVGAMISVTLLASSASAATQDSSLSHPYFIVGNSIQATSTIDVAPGTTLVIATDSTQQNTCYIVLDRTNVWYRTSSISCVENHILNK